MTLRHKIVLSVLSLVLASALAFGTFAAFVSSTSNSGNSISAASVSFSDDDAATAMFSASEILPNTTITRCINVQNAGPSAAQTVELYAAITTADLADDLDVDVDLGAGAAGGPAADGSAGTYPAGSAAGTSCTGFVKASDLFAGKLNTFPTAADAATRDADPANWGAGEGKSYRISITLPSGAAAGSSGQTAEFSLTWAGVA